MFANPLFFHPGSPGAQQAGTIEVADHLLRILAADDGQAADIMLQHADHRVVCELISVGNDRRLRSCVKNRHCPLRILFERA